MKTLHARTSFDSRRHRRSISALFVLLVGLSSLCAQAQPGGDATLVKIDQGLLKGSEAGNGVYSFKGIPYAAPPTGALRWKAPQPPLSWTGIRDATRFGPSPIQRPAYPYEMWTEEFQVDNSKGAAGYSEDCLSLNVWTQGVAALPKPVLVFVPGGGLTSGGSSAEVYDGAKLAAQGIVVVTINYRVGIFGFLATPELTREGGQFSSGNYGILDQIAALQWVKAKIASFGGDPNQVTIMGQSAGSTTVEALLCSPLAKGLFHRAIKESYNGINLGFPTLARMETFGRGTVGNRTLAQLRSMSAQELLALQFDPGPALDGTVISGTWADALRRGKANLVPLLSGMVSGDRVLVSPFPIPFSFHFPTSTTVQELKGWMSDAFGDKSATFEKLYPFRTDTDAYRQLLVMINDYFVALQFVVGELGSSATQVPNYYYLFDRALPDATKGTEYGAFHSGELPYIFQTLSKKRLPYWTAVDTQVSRVISAYWVNFVKTGNPNGAGLPEWPRFLPGKADYQSIGDSIGKQSMDPAKKSAWLQFIAVP